MRIAERCGGVAGAEDANGRTRGAERRPRCCGVAVVRRRSTASWPMLPTVTAGTMRVQAEGSGVWERGMKRIGGDGVDIGWCVVGGVGVCFGGIRTAASEGGRELFFDRRRVVAVVRRLRRIRNLCVSAAFHRRVVSPLPCRSDQNL